MAKTVVVHAYILSYIFSGETKVLKLLSVNPEYPDAPREAIRRILGSPAGQPIDHSRIESIRMGTTVATNALLERKGTKTALCITKGFKEPFPKDDLKG